MAKGSGKGGGTALNIVSIVCTLAEAGFAIAILYLVSELYTDVIFGVVNGTLCLLDGYNPNDGGICFYAWSVAALSLMISLIVSIIKCVTCCCHKVPHVVEVTFDVIAAIWWLASSITLTVKGVEANSLNFPEESKRNMIIGFNWAVFMLFSIQGVVECKSMAED
mmetsp:Transcript_9179/g.22914  ORF Transcript_9179/g.22914 Transcript_9179/m.22914 type:complete len:165 (+) Transcript_9179:159-653(+)